MKQIKTPIILLIIFILMTPMVYANEQNNTQIVINTNLDEASKIYEILEKRGYEVVSFGELDMEANFDPQKTGLSTMFLLDKLKFVMFGTIAILVIALFVKAIKNWRSNASLEEDHSYMDLTNRLGDSLYPSENYSSVNSYDNQSVYNSHPNEPVIKSKNDYSRYCDNSQSNLIRQKTMYYK